MQAKENITYNKTAKYIKGFFLNLRYYTFDKSKRLKDWLLKDSSNLLLTEIFQNTSVSCLTSGVSRSPYHYSTCQMLTSTYLCWHHTLNVYITYLWWCHILPGCWCYIPVVTSYPPWMLMWHTCSDVISSLDVDVTYLWWRHTLPGCWCYIPVVTSYPPWMLMLHTCADVIPSLDVDQHVGPDDGLVRR